jgi:chemotaxis protein MotA
MLYLVGFVTVLTGTLGAAFASYPTVELTTALKVAVNSYRTQPPTKKEIVDALLTLSRKSRVDGLMALEGEEERVSVLFLRRALSMLMDGFTVNELRDMLNNETYFFQQRRAQHERIFRHLARLALASGIAGSVVVMIGILANSGDNAEIVRAIPVALTSLLHGIVLANFLFVPVAENICTKTHEELLILKLVTEGVPLISMNYNTLRLQTYLESFVSPRVRDIQHKSFKEIHEQYEKFRHAQPEQAGRRSVG